MNDRHSGNASRDAALERFARRAFTEDLARIDPSVRARLAGARRGALDAASTRRSALPSAAGRIGPRWVLAGSVALVLAVAVALRPSAPEGGGTEQARLVVREESAPPPAGGPATDELPAEALVLPRDLELLAGGEPDVLDALDEDLAFYVWLEQQPELAAAGAGAGR